MKGRHTNRSPRLAIAAGTTAVVLAVGGGVAYAATGQPTAATPGTAAAANATPSAAAARRHHGGRLELRRLAGRAVHGTVVLHTKKGDKTIDFQRGTVSAVVPASGGTGEIVTVVSVDHFTHSYTLTAKTRVRESGHKVAAAELKVGGKVAVVATPVAGVDDGLVVRIAPAA